MPYTWMPGQPRKKLKTHGNLMTPVNNILPDITPLHSRCNRPRQMTFEDQINILVYFHLEEYRSGRHLLQVLKEEHFARQHIAPVGGIEKSSFFEDISSRGWSRWWKCSGSSDAVVLLGTPGINQTEREVRLVGYRVASVNYWVATDRQTKIYHMQILNRTMLTENR